MYSKINQFAKLMLIVGSFTAITGCASIVEGAHQSISITTPPTKGAACSLKNDKGIWYVNDTPGSVMVHQSYYNLIVNCQRKNYMPATITVKSSTRKMAAGNILFGGIIGGGVDAIDGAAYLYPNNIEVPMKKIK